MRRTATRRARCDRSQVLQCVVQGGEAARRDMAKDTSKPASGSQHCGQDDVA